MIVWTKFAKQVYLRSKTEKLHFYVRPWSLLAIFDFSAREPTTQRRFNVFSPSSLRNNYLLVFAEICHYHENTKQLMNEIKWNKRNQTCHFCHTNAWNPAYLMSYQASHFKCVKHVQNLSLKNSKT